jgi:hypothetical protein
MLIISFLVQIENLYRVNISSGATTLISSDVGNGGGNVNAMGYNVGDNYLYAALGSSPPQRLVRIAANGATTLLESLNQTVYLNNGEIDENYHCECFLHATLYFLFFL